MVIIGYVNLDSISDDISMYENNTICFWYKSNGDLTSSVPLFTSVKSWSSPRDVVSIYLTNLGTTLRATYYNETGHYAKSQSSLSVDDWHHVCLVREDNATILFVDGVGATGILSPAYSSSGSAIGGAISRSEYFNGSIDEFRVYNRSFSSEEVTELYFSNLNRINGSNWIFYVNQSKNSTSPLETGNHSFEIFASNLSKVFNSSGLRMIQKFPTPFNLIFPFDDLIVQRGVNFSIRGNVTGNLEGYTNIKNITVEYSGTNNGEMFFTNFINESFNLSLYLEPGLYNLSVHDSSDITAIQRIQNVGVGDVILVIGQSNAARSSYPESNLSLPDWPIMSAYLNISGSYNESTPVILEDIKNYDITWSAYELRNSQMAYNISLAENVSVMVFNMAVGGTDIDTWQNNTGDNYYLAVKNFENFTGGNMNVKAVYWHQGENDVGGTYANYYGNLSSLVNRVFVDFNVLSEKLVLAQILKSSSDSTSPRTVREAQQDIWSSFTKVFRGPVTYDLELAPGEVHYDSNQVKLKFAERISRAIMYQVYGNGEDYPLVDSIYLINSTLLHIKYDTSDLKISVWNETSNNSIAKGFNLTDGVDYVDDDSVLSTLFDGSVLKVSFNQSISGMKNISICSDFSCYGEPVVRGLNSDLPAQIVYDLELIKEGEYVCGAQGKYWYSDSCNSEPSSTESASPSGSTGSSTSLGFSNGVVKRGFPKGHVLSLEKGSLEVESFDEGIVSLSFGEELVNISLNKTKKIDLDDDGFYDYEIGYSGSVDGFADLVITEIYEEIPSIVEEVVVDGEVEEEIVEERIGFFERVWNWIRNLFTS